jgi:hypothetical protein
VLIASSQKDLLTPQVYPELRVYPDGAFKLLFNSLFLSPG